MNRIAVVAIALALAVPGCKQKEKGAAKLPPAAGSGAAPLPELPPLDPGSGAGSAVESSTATVVAGTLEAREQVAVAPKGQGTIVRIAVEEGAKVKKGDVLFQLDSRDALLMKKQAMNQLAGAELQLRTAQREYDRVKGLVGQNAVPQQQLDTLEAQVDGAKLAIAAAQTSIAMTSKSIGDAAARSPLTGVVIKKLMNVGEYATMMPPSPVVIVQDQAALDVKFRLSERALTAVSAGDAVTVRLPSLGQTRAATVARVSPMIDPRTRTLEVVATLDNCDAGLKPGLAAEITLGAPTGDVTAPACAGARGPAKGRPAPRTAP